MPTISGGARAQSASTSVVTLTDAQIKALLTPRTLVPQPNASTGVGVVSVAAVLDCTHGVYTDPDGSFHGVSFGYPPDPDVSGAKLGNWDIDDGSLGTLGPGVYPSFSLWAGAFGGNALPGFGVLYLSGTTPPSSFDFIVKKVGAVNLTGGGAGNTLKVTVVWVPVPLS